MSNIVWLLPVLPLTLVGIGLAQLRHGYADLARIERENDRLRERLRARGWTGLP